MWRLRPGWSAELVAGQLILRSDTRRLRVTSDVQFPKGFPQALLSGTTGRDESGLTAQAGESLVIKLVEQGVMMRIDGLHGDFEGTAGSVRQCEYFDHIGICSSEALRRIQDSKVLLLGLGGTGSIVLQHLVGAGMRSFALVDDDIVEQSNLGRQFIYSNNDVGVKKTHAARDYILSRSPSANVQVSSQRINTEDDLRGVIASVGPVDLCVICIDQPPGKVFEITTKVLWNIRMPCIHGGVMIRSGFYGPLFDAERSRHAPASFSIWRDAGQAMPTSPLRIAFAPYNTIIAALMAAECLHFLAGAFDLVDFQYRTFLDLSRGRFIKIESSDEVIGVE